MTEIELISPLKQINALNDIFWNEMLLYDKYKDIHYTVKNKKRYLTKERDCSYIICFDSETFKGKCRLLASYSKKERFIFKPNFEQCLDFLFYRAYQTNGYRFFYNIDFDISAILKIWNDIEKISLLKLGIEIKYKKYRMLWFQGKFFKLTKNKRSVYFTDLFNFFKIGLEKASKDYLKDTSKDDIDGNLLNTSLNYWHNNLDDIIKYCIKDCKITWQLSWLLINSLKKAEVSLPKILVSSGSLAKQDFRIHCRVNNLYNIPKTIIQIAYDTYFGGKFEIQKRGFFDILYLYDINSQYPDFFRNLYDVSYGIWQKIDYIPKKQCLAYFNVNLNIPENIEISTIPMKLKNSIILTVCGIIKNRWLTWYDLDLMRDYITKINNGYIFKPTIREKEVKRGKLKYVIPFRKRIDYHYKMKSKYKGIENKKMLYNIHKLTMNAFYGACIERHENINIDMIKSYSVGVLFNPIYASQVCAFGRWSVIKKIPRDKWKFICGIHTDSIISMIPLDKYLKIDDKIGNWNLEVKGKGLIINTGMYQIDDLIKTRGIPNKYIVEKDKNGNIIKDWFTFCKENKYLDEKEFEILHMRKISESLIRDKNLDNLNIMTIEPRTININSDSKRHWKSKFHNFDDILNRKISSYLWYFKSSEIESEISFNNIYQNPLLT